MNEATIQTGQRFHQRFARLMIVLAGIVVGQFILFGPSLTGQKILLPLDVLQQPDYYIAASSEAAVLYPQDPIYLDKVLQFEPDRRFAVRELKAGRFPLWTPYQYGGVPFIWPKYSPFSLFSCLTESPVVLAWAQMLAALVAGTGVYFFSQRSLGVGFWPATFVAWCYPLTGFFIFWQGYPTCASAYWLPWLLLAVDGTVLGGRIAPVGLGLVTGLVLVSGHIDVAGQVLLVSGLFALWRVWDLHFRRQAYQLMAKTMVVLSLGWSLGFLLAAPHVLPLMEYAKTGYRMLRRSSGAEERPPVGLVALPQVLLPDAYGSTQRGACPVSQAVKTNLPESAAATYTGLLATLLVVPWAWSSRRHRASNVFWTSLAVLGLSWCLNLPGLVQLLRLPGLNFMSHNRLVFATSFAILAMTAVGLQNLMEGKVVWRRSSWLPFMLLAGLFAWCAYHAVVVPEQATSRIELTLQRGGPFNWMKDANDVRQAQSWLLTSYRVSATLCGAGLILLLGLRTRRAGPRILLPVAGILLIGDLLWFGYGRIPQCDPALYFPEIPALRNLAKAGSDRVIGYNCFPAKLSEIVGLKDVRGYDSVDPSEWLAVLMPAADSRTTTFDYAMIQWLIPRIKLEPPNKLQLSPILDMLAVRHVIFRGEPHPEIKPGFQSPDYWVLENRNALSRVFVPRQVQTVTDDEERFRKLGSADFSPRQIAYVETSVNLPGDCHGAAEIIEEIPERISIKAQMTTPGLLVLADLWNKGWRAYLNGQPAPILKVNHAIRGVVVPAGASTLEFRYEPSSVHVGRWLSGLATLFSLGWIGFVVARNRRSTNADTEDQKPSPCIGQ